MNFIDIATLKVEAGNGGNGCCSFRREKSISRGGPDGGDGGRGGSVIVEARADLDTLLDLKHRQKIKAERGCDGEGNMRTGASGEQKIVLVPVGTIVRDAESGLVLRDLKKNNEQVTVARGGRGGHGNTFFASATNQVPRHVQEGTPGETRELEFELKLLADVALLGLPNAGKSTLISSMSAAHPKVANYPFTTLTPCLGIVELGEFRRFVMVDLPGLIEGAHEGVGLGDQFLRHMERCRVLCHVVDATAADGMDPLEAFDVIDKEVKAYSTDLASRPRVIALNKIDALGNREVVAELAQQLYEKSGAPVELISGVSGEGLETLKTRLTGLLGVAP